MNSLYRDDDHCNTESIATVRINFAQTIDIFHQTRTKIYLITINIINSLINNKLTSSVTHENGCKSYSLAVLAVKSKHSRGESNIVQQSNQILEGDPSGLGVAFYIVHHTHRSGWAKNVWLWSYITYWYRLLAVAILVFIIYGAQGHRYYVGECSISRTLHFSYTFSSISIPINGYGTYWYNTAGGVVANLAEMCGNQL